nr:hypothetical protein [Tanacetum cinerariifolium]
MIKLSQPILLENNNNPRVLSILLLQWLEIPTALIPPVPSVIVAPSAIVAPPTIVALFTDIISPVDAPLRIRRQRAILIRLGQDIPVGRLYRTHPGRPCRDWTTRMSVGPLPSHRLALRYTSHHLDCFNSRSSSYHLSFDQPLADHFLADHTSDISPSDSSTTNLDRHSHSSSHFTRPSRKRYTSPTTTAPSSISTLGELVPTHADLLPACKRFRDSISLEYSVEEDIDADVLLDIEADTVTIKVAACMYVKVGIDAGIGIKVDVWVDREEEDVEAESSERGTREVRVDVVDGIDIPYGQRTLRRERQLEVESLIASRERAGLLDRVAALERSNTRLRDTLRIESLRADRLRRRMGFMADELMQIRRFCYYDGLRFRRLEAFAARRLGFRP